MSWSERVRQAFRDAERRYPWIIAARELGVVAVAMDPVYDHASFRFYADGTESGSTALANEDTDLAKGDIANDTVFGVRFGINNTGSGNGNIAPKLQYRRNAGSWTDVNASSTHVQSAASGSLTDDEVTSNRLANGTGTWEAGYVDEADGTFGSTIALNNGNWSEWHWSIQIIGSAVSDNDTIDFRAVEGDGTVLANWTGSAAQLATMTVEVADNSRTATDGVDLGDSRTVGIGEYQVDGVALGEDFTTVWSASFDADGVVLSDLAGRSHDATATDGVALGDTSSAVIAFKGTATDGVDLGDSHTVGVGDGATDGVDLGDTATPVHTHKVSATDGVDLGDTASFPADTARAASDGVALGDTSSALRTTPRSVTDGLDLGDTPTALRTTPRSETDGVDLGDTPTALRTASSAATDGVDLGDSTAPVGVGDSATDGVALGDTAAHADNARSVTDGVQLGEDFTTVWSASFDADGVVLADTPTYPNNTRSASDGVVLSDVAGRSHDATATDGVSLGEDFNTTVTVQGQPTGVVLGDTATAVVAYEATDGVVLSDTAAYAADTARSATDGANLGDTAQADVSTARSDGVSLSDALAIMVGFNVTISDGATFGDTLGTQVDTAAAVSDGITLGDTATGLASAVVSLGLLELWDIQCQSVALSDRVAQYVELRDAASGTVEVSDG